MRAFDFPLKKHEWEQKRCVDVHNISSYKIPMEGAHLKLVKDKPRTFQDLDFVFGSLIGILRIVRLYKILVY